MKNQKFCIASLILLWLTSFQNVNSQPNTFPWPAAGHVGIGTAVPNQRLTIDFGNINIQPTSNGYMIANNMVLDKKCSVL